MRIVLLAMAPLMLLAQAPAPLTVGERAALHARRVASPLAVLGSGASAAVGQCRGEPQPWGGGMAGLGRRYASSHGYLGAQNLFHFGLGAAFLEDPRYRRSGETRIPARIRHAALSTVIARTPDSRSRYNFALVGSHVGAAMLANQWHPPGYDNVGDGFTRAAIGVGFSALRNVAAEFWPDVTARVFRRKPPPAPTPLR
jgi:hypothetical protein